MRLAYITTHFPFGHDETFFRPEVRSLARALDGLFVVPVRPKHPHSAFGNLGSTDIYIPAAGAATWVLAWNEFVRRPDRVCAVLRSILTPSYRLSAKFKNLLLFPKALATTSVLRTIGIDHIHAQWLTTSSTVAFVASALLEIPWSCTAHQHDIFFDNLIPEKVANAAFVRVISQRNADFLIGLTGTELQHRTHVVHLGVDVPEQIVQRCESGVVRLLCAARLERSKGHRYLIEALALLRARGLAFHCDFAGDGELRTAIEEQIEAAEIGSCVELRGIVQHERLVAELESGHYDIAVLASTEVPGEHEGIPVAMMEAMAAAVPCVATATGSNHELIDASCGILVAQRNPEALARALERLIADPESRRALGRTARVRVTHEFETTRTTSELLSLIASAE